MYVCERLSRLFSSFSKRHTRTVDIISRIPKRGALLLGRLESGLTLCSFVPLRKTRKRLNESFHRRTRVYGVSTLEKTQIIESGKPRKETEWQLVAETDGSRPRRFIGMDGPPGSEGRGDHAMNYSRQGEGVVLC